MSRFIVGDIHGSYDKLMTALELCKFSDSDILYCTGDIAPGLISKPIVYQIFQSETLREDVDESIAKNKNYYFQISKKIDIASLAKYDHNNHNILGQFFIFFKFVRALVKMAMITFNKEDFKDISSQEKLILFFQKIEVSEGFLSFELKTNKTHNEKTACIIKQELLDKIADYLEGKDTNEQPTEQQKGKIIQTAQEILDARALYPDSSLADLSSSSIPLSERTFDIF